MFMLVFLLMLFYSENRLSSLTCGLGSRVRRDFGSGVGLQQGDDAQRYLGLWVRRRARTGWLEWLTIRRPVHIRWNRYLLF